jgi:RNA polymerase sigma factor (TIGR02999 family)
MPGHSRPDPGGTTPPTTPPPATQVTQVTQILQAMQTDPKAQDRLLPVVYDELRMLARQRLRNERAGHTLQATALVHEAFMRLIGDQKLPWQSRAHFFGACANAMRQILVDHARARGAKKRGGGIKPESITHAEVADTQDLDLILTIDDCLDRLRAEDERAAAVVELRFFSGLEMAEIAEALQISERTAHREWSFARVRLFQMLAEDQEKTEE